MKNSNGVKTGDVINVRFTKKEIEKINNLNINVQKMYEEQARDIAKTFKKSK